MDTIHLEIYFQTKNQRLKHFRTLKQSKLNLVKKKKNCSNYFKIDVFQSF